VPGKEILIASTTEDVVEILRNMPETERRASAIVRASECSVRIRPAHRARELEAFIDECRYQISGKSDACVTKE
jgi:hypothetical protein